MEENKIIVLDFGGQYAHLIANRVRRLKVYSEILDPTASIEELEKARGVILSGGPSSVYDESAPEFNPEIFKLKKPLLGLCYGHQLMAHQLDGKVKPGKTKEYGTAKLQIKNHKGLFEGLGDEERVWMSHGDTVEKAPEGFEVLGSTADCENAAIGDFKRQYFGLQFHAEVTHTPNGMKMLENFVFGVCGCKADWTMENYIEEKAEDIRKTVGEKNVFLLASGGVDSTVALALLSRALGKERVYALHVDHGFMRKDESALVEEALKKLGLSELHVVDASKDFFGALKGVTAPEEKRKIIGKLFIDTANKELRKLELNPEEWLLGQGTIYPDTIETGRTKHAAVIKTHHNRIESIRQMIEEGRVIEPIDQLYKDEVRELGEKLGLSQELVWRHPFPGPGLAIRALCSDGEKEKGLEEIEEKANIVSKGFGYTSIILPVKSVGVQGDARTYRHAVALEGEVDWEKLEEVSTSLTNKVSGVNRIVVKLFPEKVEKVELVEGYITRERMDLLREADDVVHEVMKKHGLMKEIWQCPVVLIPVRVNGKGESVVVRPVLSREAMTAKFAPMPEQAIQEIVEGVSGIGGIGAVFYDVTHKPPGTICWE